MNIFDHTLRHEERVPRRWWERADRNPWFDRASGTIKMPATIKDPRNFVLTRDEAVEYDKVLAQMADFVTAERNRMRLLVNMMDKGYYSEVLHGAREPQPHTLAHVMEFMCRLGHAKLEALQFLTRLSGRVLEAKRQRDARL